ncbi:Art5p Ecym_2761 [Eremothecium cymbalariae DBVPG|uniref:Arrestin C-terminal-like domain-containing protein n=1 Tax=Eremothecium cymbalariae (strain CBS 270.75 / DBVPG 7215 / KCTC 17166 / NRRL Y-17582) TaxID=931890 RepID=G8JPZ7_ERECY|nr:Hypothetical protein Ecym_2761 [Eremothecium cymbalariae DBVPG\
MFSLGKSSSKQPVYFDVRVTSNYQDIVLIEGSHFGAGSVLLSGHLVFSITETVSVKAIILKLIGRYKLEFLQIGQHKSNNVVSLVKKEQVIFECVWDNLLTCGDGVVLDTASAKTAGGSRGGNSSSSSSRNNGYGDEIADSDHAERARMTLRPSRSNHVVTTRSSVSETRKILMRSKSSPILRLPEDGITGTPYEQDSVPRGASFVLPKGNYELPFRVVLPDDISETVEGLQSGSVFYRFESHIERGGFKTAFSNYKYLRIFRTLSADNLAIQEEVCVGKSWPDRLQYEVSIPSRAIPIGGSTPIHIKLYPFQKGYRLHNITISLSQYYAFQDASGSLYYDEKSVVEKSITDFGNINGCHPEHGNLLNDSISILSVLQLPDDLKQITQNCDIGEKLIRVRHKLQIHIILKKSLWEKINTSAPLKNVAASASSTTSSAGTPDTTTTTTNDGPHDRTTEIKASIPVILFISPHVPIKGRMIMLDNSGKFHIRSGVLTDLFHLQPIINPLQSSVLSSDPSSCILLPACQDVPPAYHSHIHDPLYTENVLFSAAPAPQSSSIPSHRSEHYPAQTSAPPPCSSPPSSSPSRINFTLPQPTSSQTMQCLQSLQALSLDDISRVPAYHSHENSAPLHYPAPEYRGNVPLASASPPPNIPSSPSRACDPHTCDTAHTRPIG